jgi:uncharacterized membrane protein YadS
MRVALLAPLVAAVVMSVRARRGAAAATAPATEAAADGPTGTSNAQAAAAGARGAPRRPPLVPLFVAGFLLMIAVRTTGWLPQDALDAAQTAQELLLAAALFGLGRARADASPCSACSRGRLWPASPTRASC